MPEMKHQVKAVLFFFYMTGCEVCEEMEPVIDAFARANPDVEVQKHDLLDIVWESEKVDPPTVTPAMALFIPGRRPITLSGGGFDEDQITRWVRRYVA